MNKNALRTAGSVLAVLFMLCGAALLIYPKVTDFLYNEDVQKQKEVFYETRQETPLDSLYTELQRRNHQLYIDKQKDLVDPWSYEQPGIDLTEYGLEGNVIGFIKIPKMEIELPILLGASHENMAKGAVHLTQTSYPIGGQNTNCVIAAHRGYRKTAMFRDIEKLELGDEVIIENLWGTLVYEVTELRIISPEDTDQLLIQDGRDMVSIFTCHPFRHNYQRYVAYCQRKTT